MKNIHILPTNKPSRLYKCRFKGHFILDPITDLEGCFEEGFDPQNIYITSDEEIKNCYYFNSRDNAVRKNNNLNHPYHHKIILTDNKDLIKDGVQAIDDEFLEWFVNNPSCERVEVKNPLIANVSDFGYKIIIPKEEPKQDLEKEMFELEQELDIPSHLRWHNSKPKQETLEVEEAAKNYANDWEEIHPELDSEDMTPIAVSKIDFIAGAKWQQEQILDFLYSEITERRDYSASKMCEKIIEFIKNK